MKRIVFILIIVLIFLCGCAKTKESLSTAKVDTIDKQSVAVKTTDNSKSEVDNSTLRSTEIIVNEKTVKERGMFYIGMMLNDLNSLELYNTDNEISQIVPIEDNNNDWDYGHKAVWTPSLCCLFDENEILYKITVNGDLGTTLGLNNGDSINVLDKLYGKYANKYDLDGGYVLEYNLEEQYFFVNISDGIINLWGISKYRYDYKGN